jgi:hypothetical protein
MNSTLRGILIGIAAVAVGLILFVGGLVVGRFGWAIAGYGPGMMAAYWNPTGQAAPAAAPYRYGMMGYGYGQAYTNTVPYGYGMMGPGMMGGWGSSGLYGNVEPLSLEKAKGAVEDYLAALGNDDLALHEIMIFDNNAYAEVVEKSSGIGAFEVLVDPVSLAVYPEPGPNMMWNLKYGHMDGLGMTLAPARSAGVGNFGRPQRGGMMGPGRMMRGLTVPNASSEMPVSPEQAIQTAQSYLDRYLTGTKVEDGANPFYGYYTLDVQRDGKTVGMLSVNGYTGQVFPHTWHGKFVETSEE